MAKKIVAGGLISPTNLWAKPLPRTRNLTKDANAKQGTRKMAREDDDVMDDEEIDVDAELAEADVEEDLDEVDVDAEDTEDVTAELAGDGPDDEEDSAADEEPDYDGEEGDVEDESQNVVEDDEEVVTAVADDEETGDEENVSTFSEVSEDTMAEKMSLSDHVRAEITRRQKAGESLRGKDIVEALGKRKITVSPAQVSQLLKKAGLGGASRKGRPAKAATPATAETEKSRAAMKAKKRPEAVSKPAAKPAAATQPRQALKARPAASNGFKVPLTQLQAAEAFVDACGGSFKDAERILTAAAQLSQTFGG